MAYLEHGMWEVFEVLRRIHAGEGRRSVARNTGRSRSTVDRYLEIAAELGWHRLAEPDEELACKVAARLRPGPRQQAPDSTEARLLAHRDQLRQWLASDDPHKRGLTLTKAHELLSRRGVEVSYSGLFRFATKHLDFGREQATVRVAECEAGELAEVDFGRLGLVADPACGRKRVLHALVVTLVFSRHQYVYTTHSQQLTDLIDGLEEAWAFFGGCTARVVIDNLKAAVTKADRYDPFFQRTFEEYARYRGFTIDAALVRHPKGKPHVERQVPFVRESMFRGEHFLDRDHVQHEAIAWCLGRAGLRIHGTTRKQPLRQFELYEQQALRPLHTPERFDVPGWGQPKVHPDCHVRFGNALYSVPYPHKGKETTVRGDRSLVRVYVGGQLVKVHPTQPPGGRSTDYSDYPPEKTAYAMRDADHIIAKARRHGTSLGRFAERLLSGDFPWAKLRQAQKLLRLVDKYGPGRVEAACHRALSFDLANVGRVEAILTRALESEATPAASTAATAKPRAQVVQLPLRFSRPADSFRHQPATKEDSKDGD